MGGCCDTQKELVSISGSIDQLIEDNDFLLNGLILHFFDHEELGMTMKLIKIQDLTRSYYSTVQEERHDLVTQNKLEEDEFSERTMKREMAELRCANKLFNYLFQSIIGHEQIEITEFIQLLEEKHKDSPALKKLYVEYEDFLSENKSFDELVEHLNGEKPLSYEQEIYIRRICQVTTYTFSTKSRRLSYR